VGAVTHGGALPRIDAATADFLGGPLAVVVATRDAGLRPHLTRGWGPSVVDDGRGLRLCVSARPELRTLGDLADNGRIAVTLSRPATYRSLQVKGGAALVEEMTTEDGERAVRHREAFAAEVADFGLSRAVLERMVAGPLVAVTFEVAELYDQTPGPGAGARL
jgi:hypothetical protein